MNAKIGKQIKILRNRDGVTQDRLADALGVTSQAISKWKSVLTTARKSRGRLSMVHRICKAIYTIIELS